MKIKKIVLISTVLFTGLPTQTVEKDIINFQKVLLETSMHSNIGICVELANSHKSDILAAYNQGHKCKRYPVYKDANRELAELKTTAFIAGLKQGNCHSGISGWISSLFKE